MKNTNTHTLSKIFAYTQPYKKQICIIILSLLIVSIFAAVRPYMAKTVVDSYISPKDKNGLQFFCLLMAIVLIIEVTAQFTFNYFANWLGQFIIKDIRTELFHKIIHYKQSFFDKEAVGMLVTRNVSDIQNIASIFSQGLFVIIADVLKMFIVLCVMFYMNWRLTLIVFFTMSIVVYITNIFQKKMKKTFQEVRNQVSELNRFVQERISGIKILKLFTQETNDLNKFKAINKKHREAWKKNILYNSVFFPVTELISSITLGGVILYGGYYITQGGNLTTTGDLFAYTLMMSMLFTPLKQIADKFNSMQMGLVASERVLDMLDKPENFQKEGKLLNQKLMGNVSFKNVYFSYNEKQTVLKNINLEIKPGQTIAFVGATGAGKSTIINLLSRLYDIEKGTILIDGMDIQNFSLKNLRNQISVVLQDVFLFNDSIFNNITLNNPKISLKEVKKVAKEIGIHDFIESLPNQYHYNIKERGAMLSSGQRQLLAFLRAFLSNPSILILDEATSSVDSYSEQLIQKATDIITKNRTSIIIAHRLSTIINADTIVVMKKGKIVEKGTHTELLNIKDGYYKKLHHVQFKQS